MENYRTDPAMQQHSPDTPLTPQQQRLQLTQEDLRTLKECNRESFYQRCLPIGSTFAALTYLAVKNGYLKGSARFGPAPKMAGAVFLGYMIGKASYQQKCAEKLMKLDTPVAEMLRKQKGAGKLGFQETFALDQTFQSIGVADEDTSGKPGKGLQAGHSDVMDIRPISNFDTEHSIFTGADYNKPIDSTADMLNEDNLPPRAPSNYATTYDDLRKANRVEYEASRFRQQPPVRQPPPQQPLPEQPPPQDTYRPPAPGPGQPRKIKNQYGDVWDDVPRN